MNERLEEFDAVIVGSGFGGSIPAFHLASSGARVLVLERGPRLNSSEFDQSLKFGSSSTRIFDFTAGDGMSVLGGNCVGGGSVVYFAAMPRAPHFTFERRGSTGHRLWPQQLDRKALDPWYDRVAEALPIRPHDWTDVSFAGGTWAAMCNHSGRTANPLPSAVDTTKCTNCNWMMSGCAEDAKQSLLLNYIPAAESYGAQVRPLHEVQYLTRDESGWYTVYFNTIHPVDYRETTGSGAVRAKVVIMAAGAAATPVILQRSEEYLGAMPPAVGRYFSGNGERINLAVLNDDELRSRLDLDRGDGTAYDAFQIGRGPVVATWDRQDGSLPEFERYAIEQLYFPPGLGTILAQALTSDGSPGWFGSEKKDLLRRWKSWLLLFELVEDDNEGEFGAPPPTGNAVRLSQQLLGRGTLRYRPRESTLRAWQSADSDIRHIIQDAGFGSVTPWTNDPIGAYTVHPLASCRIGHDPSTSALDHTHELRGHQGIYVTDGSAVPAALTVNPSNTIAALAERAVPFIINRLQSRDTEVRYEALLPDRVPTTI